MDDRQLIARVLAGDPAAERSLYERHVDRVYRLAYRLAGNADLAEEFTQATFVRAFERLAGFRGEAALSSWLHAITVSVTISGLRRLSRRRCHEVPREDLEAVSEATVDGRQIELQRRLCAAIDALPELLRIVFVMHCTEGYTHGEIADVLGIPTGTSKARLARARRLLRAQLGASDSAGGPTWTEALEPHQER